MTVPTVDARRVAGGPLLDGDRGRQAVDVLDRRLLQLADELAGVAATGFRRSGAGPRRRSCPWPASVLPLPLGPQQTVIWSRGTSTSTLRRLCCAGAADGDVRGRRDGASRARAWRLARGSVAVEVRGERDARCGRRLQNSRGSADAMPASSSRSPSFAATALLDEFLRRPARDDLAAAVRRLRGRGR